MSKYDEIIANDLSVSGVPLREDKPEASSGFDYEQMFQEQRRQEAGQLAASYRFGVDKNPDEWARILDLAKKTKTPLAIVESDPKAVEKAARIRYFDPNYLLEVAPVTARMMQNPMFAGLGYDELSRLQAIETAHADFSKGRAGTAWSKFARGAAGLVSGVMKTSGIQSAEVAGYTIEAFDAIDRGDPVMRPGARTPRFDLVKQYQKADQAGREAIREQVGQMLDPAQHAAYKAGKTLDKALQNAFKTNPRYADEFFAGNVAEGFGSMFGFMTATVLSGGGGGAFLGSLAETAGAYEDAINSGASIETAIRAANVSGLSGLTEAVPIMRIFERADKVTGGAIRKTLLDMLKAGTEEGIQETSQGLWRNLVASEVFAYDPDRGVFEGTLADGAAAFTVGGLAQFLTSLLFGRRNAAHRIKSAGETSVEQEFLDIVHQEGKDLKTAQRSPEGFRDLLAQIQETYGPDEAIYIPADHLAETLEQLGLPDDSPLMQRLAPKLQEAMELEGGADVVMPVSEYIGLVATSEHADVFREIVRASADSLSLRELKEASGADPLKLAGIIEKANQQAELKVEVDEILAELEEELRLSGVVGAPQAAANARVFTAYVKAKAFRSGRSAREVFDEIKLQIKGPETITVPRQIYNPGQALTDVMLEESYVLEDTGEQVTASLPAQDMWDGLQERRTKITELMNCLYG